jgi:hypothetical protein
VIHFHSTKLANASTGQRTPACLLFRRRSCPS